jgi:hypothetical protein
MYFITPILAVVLVALIIGVILSIFLQGSRQSKLMLQGQQISATVLSVEEYHASFAEIRRGYDFKRYRIAARWQDPQTQREYTFQKRNLFHQPHCHQGSTITVYIDPHHPQRYYISDML